MSCKQRTPHALQITSDGIYSYRPLTLGIPHHFRAFSVDLTTKVNGPVAILGKAFDKDYKENKIFTLQSFSKALTRMATGLLLNFRNFNLNIIK